MDYDIPWCFNIDYISDLSLNLSETEKWSWHHFKIHFTYFKFYSFTNHLLLVLLFFSDNS